MERDNIRNTCHSCKYAQKIRFYVWLEDEDAYLVELICGNAESEHRIKIVPPIDADCCPVFRKRTDWELPNSTEIKAICACCNNPIYEGFPHVGCMRDLEVWKDGEL